MATQEVVLKFRGDPSLLKGALAEIRREHAAATAEITRQQKAEAQAAIALQRTKARAILQEEKQLAAQMIRESRAAQNVRTQAERQAVAEIARMERQRRQIMAENARAVGAIAKGEADARIREGRRAANAALGTLKSGSGGSDIAAALGFGGGAALGALAISEIRAGAAAWVNYASKLESTKIAFTTMLGSAERATAHIKELQAFAIKTPFQFEELIDASQRMQALGFEAEQVIPILTDVGNAVAAAGGGSERLDRVVIALSQIQSKGRVMTQELNQLAEAGIPVWKLLSEQLGKSRAELVKMVEQGEISSAVFLDAFQKFSRQNFGGLMEKQAKTFAGAMSNIKDALLLTASTAFAPLFEKLTQTALEIGRIGSGLGEAASGLARLTNAVGVFAGAASGLGNVPVPKIIEALLNVSGIKGVTGLLGLAGTPEIGPIGGTGDATKPVPLRSSEQFADAEQTSALRAQSEEAKRIATERIADQERLFKLGKLTRAQETENIIVQLQIRASAEEQALNDEIARKHKELLASKDNADKVSTVIQQVGQLEQQIKNNQSELDRQIADKRAELQLQERRNLLEHNQRRTATELQAAATIIAAIEAEVEAGVTTREEGLKKIEQIENAGLDRRGRLLKFELALAGVEPAERQQIIDKIAALDIERTSKAQEQANRRREILKQENVDELELNRQLVNIRNAQREVERARIDAMLEISVITESTAAAARLKVLIEEHRDRMTLLDIESEHQTTTGQRKLAIDNEKIASEIRYTAEVARLTQERIDAAEREAFERGERPGGGPGGAGTPEDEIARQAAAIVNQQLGPPPEMQAHIDMVGMLRTAYQDLAIGVAQGVGTIVQNFVLMGNAGPQAFKKVLASALAAVSAQAAVQAIYELALGFAALTPWGAAVYGPAALHFKAAALLAGIALVAGAAGRVTAGSAFQSTTAGATGGGASGSRSSTTNTVQPKPIDIDRRNQTSAMSAIPNITVVVTGQATEGFKYMVESVAVESVRLNGPFRKIQQGEDV